MKSQESISRRGIKPASNATHTQGISTQLEIAFELGALSLAGILPNETLTAFRDRCHSDGGNPAEVISEIVSKWLDDESDKEGREPESPDEWERFTMVLGTPLFTKKQFGCRMTAVRRDHHFYWAIEGLAILWDGDYTTPEEIADENGEDGLAELFRKTPGGAIKRLHTFEPITREGVLEEIFEHVLPQYLPAEFVPDFAPKGVPQHRPLPLIVPTEAPKDGNKTFMPSTYGVAMGEWPLDELAIHVACELHTHRELFSAAAWEQCQSREACGPCRAGDLQEVLLIASIVDEKMQDGFTWHKETDFAVPGFGAPQAMGAQEFLEQAAQASAWAWHAVRDEAMRAIPPREALGLLEALVTLEGIACEYLGMPTEFDNEGPTSLMRSAGKCRFLACKDAA